MKVELMVKMNFFNESQIRARIRVIILHVQYMCIIHRDVKKRFFFVFSILYGTLLEPMDHSSYIGSSQNLWAVALIANVFQCFFPCFFG